MKKMPESNKRLVLVAVICVTTLLLLLMYCKTNSFSLASQEMVIEPKRSTFPRQLPPSPSCECSHGAVPLKDLHPKEQREAIMQRRTKEFQQHKARTSSVLSKLLYALPNSPLQYPIQGYTVRPLTPTLIPVLELHAGKRDSYKVFLNVSKGILTTVTPDAQVTVNGAGTRGLSIESSSLVLLNELLAKVSYTSSTYHINSGDLAFFRFESHEALFPIVIKQPQVPVLYDMGTDIRSQVTIITKTFLRYPQLKVLLASIRKFYPDITVIIADDSFEPEHISGENIQQYIMPPAQGWFAGRNLAVSQVITKYLLWVDDDFFFTENTKIEEFVEVMEAVPELDVVGGSVEGNQFYFSILYEEGDGVEGGCLIRKSGGKFHPLPDLPKCYFTHGVVNFFLARTDAVRRVGFDPQLQRVAHSEFFMDGLGSLMVATCQDVKIGHQRKTAENTNPRYAKFRTPTKSDDGFKSQLHYFKNHLKCFLYS
ncbi:beta-1,4 N-acetylgalactosaminyltransferase 2-like isoform X2 [Salarias fasciatus]|uniref:beta-1,4 N-acetylgalactosaminyltransferase 2-like isoform X2 n=1 Tax=Salarias fasciatus TaxID=181472 RepID=UPI001176E7AB|nr:beta-1,4 N-acetylgalactosaminyltransferase 2-like isoform X2 [Salarias fasciatus]